MKAQKGATSVLWISTLSMIVGFATWASLSPLAVQLQKTFGLSATQKSVLVAIPILLGSLMRIPLGLLTDKYGGRRVYSALMLFLIFPVVGLGFAHSYMAYILSFLALFFFTKDLPKPKTPQPKPAPLNPYTNKIVWVLSFFYFVSFGAFMSFSIYLPSLLIDVFGITPVDAGMRAAGFVITATLARPLGGFVADRFGATRVLNIVYLLLGVSALMLSVAFENLPVMTIACLSIGFVVGIGNGSVFKLVPEYFPKHTGIVTGIVGCMGGIGGFFPPIVMGSVKDLTGTYTLGFIFLIAFTMSALYINRRLQKNPPSGKHLLKKGA